MKKLSKVAFQGEHGAYSELAALDYFDLEVVTFPCKDFGGCHEPGRLYPYFI